MNKMSRNLNRRIREDKSLSKVDISLLHLLCKYSDDLGYVKGIYYKEVKVKLGICVSEFYLVLHKLEEKGYIETQKSDNCDIDIHIYDNEFIVPGVNDEPQVVYTDYINLNRVCFDDIFYQLGGIAKRILYSLADETVVTNASRKKNHNKVTGKLFRVHDRMYTKYAKLFKVGVRTVKKAFKELEAKNIVAIYYDEEFTNKDIVAVKSSYLAKPEISVTASKKLIRQKKTAEMDGYMNIVQAFCRRKGIDTSEQSIIDSSSVMVQYKKRCESKGLSIVSLVKAAIDSVGAFLSAAGINKYISNYLNNSGIYAK